MGEREGQIEKKGQPEALLGMSINYNAMGHRLNRENKQILLHSNECVCVCVCVCLEERILRVEFGWYISKAL